MASEQVIDPRQRDERRLRGFLLRVGVPVGGVLLVVLTIAGVSLRSYQVSRKGALTLSRDLLGVQRDYGVQKVSGYLDPAARGASITAGLLANVPANEIFSVFTLHAGSGLAQLSQLDSYYIADDQGQFAMIHRRTDTRGTDVATLRTTADGNVLDHVLTDAAGTVVGQSSETIARFDPRARPWFQGAMSHPGVFWTPPYMTANSHALLVTTAQSFVGKDGHHYVLAVNIGLDTLSDFLRTLKIGASGHAIVFDGQGRVIAGRQMRKVAQESNWDPARMVPDPAHYPLIARAWDIYRVQGFGTRLIARKGRSFLVVTAPLGHAGDDWVLMLIADEADFARFARASGRQSFVFSLVVVFLTVILAGFLVRQGRLTERANRKLREARALSTEENLALGRVAGQPGLFDPGEEALTLTEALVQVAQARRASLWRLTEDRGRMVCEDCFDAAQDAHSGGYDYSRVEIGAFFDALSDGGPVVVPDAGTDSRTQAFWRVFMHQNATTALSVTPFRGAGDVNGIVVLEDAARAAESVAPFVDLVSAVAAIRFATRPAIGDKAHASADHAASRPEGAAHFGEAFLVPAREGQDMREGLFPAVAVMVIMFSNPPMVDGKDVENLLGLVERLARKVQDIAETCGLFSVKMVGHRLICTAGCTPEIDAEAPTRIVEAALALREAALVMLSQADIDPIFRIGIDVGPVLGGYLGENPSVFNLWGQTVSIAERMAQGSPDFGTIQVSEAVFQVLRDRYLFRARGAFFAPGTGVGRTYTLVGRR
ncbi:two component hybrid sensor histidine kinase and regulator [Ameyamaea chiangmaiensis NBRC 103196]|uniref:adenylate cyclase n=1 Tax=Ameyamaea chiangmaiensis TaxID=442969 RepID=A0A850PJU7_9PROT|nr:adenylate/guanylate cyclase domain-containing protein [Ameyamaea chiangmaiensis]MBS4074850.1 adenylate/guanylate cyclase domain-containing protein [Ameyamaea chiangmaiensis]NVN41561.1 adenylate/guanylate cyclase domain-containing protein [Ameyamaea chiangmaiensis]GBQ62974.1 two component hybrid sensor histidine kinase and regulator [Ameyamaea chiangmaiensis NBRC 103196]